jgi:hypothetical protein
MPVEVNRRVAKKLVEIPGGDSVYVPVIVEITFRDPSDRGQESTYTVDNSHESARVVHVDEVFASEAGQTTAPAGGGGGLQVERVDIWPIKDPVRRGQQTRIQFDNEIEPDRLPPHFWQHLKTHTVRYYKDGVVDDGGTWIESELIDQFIVKDPVDRSQETVYTLQNPDPGQDAQVPQDAVDITDPEEGTDPPWRIDPFQNIVNFSGGAVIFYEDLT